MQIRKFTLVLLIAFAFQSFCFSQNEFGVLAGVSLNNIRTDFELEEEYNTLFGYHFGLFHNFAIGRKIDFRPEIKYTRRGWSDDLDELEDESYSISDDSYDRVFLHYFELPLFINYRLEHLRIYGGPYAAICFRAINKYKLEETYTDSSGEMFTEVYEDESEADPVIGKVEENDEDEYDDVINGLDIGGEIGVAYRFGAFEMSLSYNHSFSNLVKDYPDTEEDDRDNNSARNGSVRLSFYYDITTKGERKIMNAE